MDSDFSQLYSQLGLSPQAGIEDLKRAYRRRVGQLHPDRHPNDRGTPDTQDEFAQLIALYGMAMRFHRLHGRLPGEASVLGSVGSASDAPRVIESKIDFRPTATENVGEKKRGRRGWLSIGAMALLIALAYVTAPDETTIIAPAPTQLRLPVAGSAPAPDGGFAAPEKLALGMDMALVFDIQGRPTYREGDVWEYGPSWLRFDEGQLVEWYSSPLYRLKVSTPTALQTPEDSAD